MSIFIYNFGGFSGYLLFIQSRELFQTSHFTIYIYNELQITCIFLCHHMVQEISKLPLWWTNSLVLFNLNVIKIYQFSTKIYHQTDLSRVKIKVHMLKQIPLFHDAPKYYD